MKIRIFSTSLALDVETEEQIEDAERIKKLDGYIYSEDEEDDCFGFWLVDENDESIIKSSGISGGFLKFNFDEQNNNLVVAIEYDLEKELSQEQIEALIEYTIGQCTDGIGSNFNQFKCEEIGMYLSLIEDRNAVKYEIEKRS